MEGLAQLVAESLVRHGLEPTFDHRRLQWSNWLPCQDGFSLVFAPCKPGLFALAEEVLAPGEMGIGEGKRMLALFQISEAHDLGMALGRLFLSGSPERDRFASRQCFARYVVIEDGNQRRTALTALQRWMASSAEAISSHNNHVAPDVPVRGAEQSSSGLVSQRDPENAGFMDDSQKAGFVSGHDFSRAATATISTAALAAAPAETSPPTKSSNKQAQIGPPAPIPSGF